MHPVVMTPTMRHRGLVELPMPQQRRHGVLPARRSPVDSNPIKTHPGSGFCGRPDLLISLSAFLQTYTMEQVTYPSFPIRQSRVLEILVADVVEGFVPPISAHAIDLDNYEAESGEDGHFGKGGEGFWHGEVGGAGVDIFDDGILVLISFPSVRYAIYPLLSSARRTSRDG